MPTINVDIRSLSVCIQALQQAIKFNEYLSQAESVDSDDYEESSYITEHFKKLVHEAGGGNDQTLIYDALRERCCVGTQYVPNLPGYHNLTLT